MTVTLPGAMIMSGVGATLVVAGIAAIYWPAALIAAGVLLLAAGMSAETGD